MSRVSGPKGVRACLVAGFQLPAFRAGAASTTMAAPPAGWPMRRPERGGRSMFYKHDLMMIAAAAFASYAGVAAAQDARTGSPSIIASRGPSAADVAGVHLLAAPAEARAALAKAGYRLTTDTREDDFDQWVQAEAARRRGTPPSFPKEVGTGKIMATGPNQEYLEVTFMQAAGGSQVAEVTISVPGTAISTADFRRQVRAKYGEPDRVRGQGAEMSWCSPETMRNCGASIAVSGPLDDQYPSIQAAAYEGDGARRIAMSIGQTAYTALDKAKEEAVRRLAPPVAHASF